MHGGIEGSKSFVSSASHSSRPGCREEGGLQGRQAYVHVIGGASSGCEELTVACFQAAMRTAYYERDSRRGLLATFAWLVEEVGELSEALREGDPSRIEEELADVIAWATSIANLVGIDVERALKRKYGADLEAAGCAGSGEPASRA